MVKAVDGVDCWVEIWNERFGVGSDWEFGEGIDLGVGRYG